VLSKRVRKKFTIEFDWAITLIGLCGMMHCKTICYVQSHVAKPFVMYNRICKTFCYVQSYLAKPFVMYNHIWQNLLLCTTTFGKTFCYGQPHSQNLLLCTTNHILKHPSRSMGLQFVPINWQTLCLLFQLFATIKAMLVVDLETNI
jgi:hypothetical protein